ncbi:uncharacterized protein BP5553_06768 [Venustampulla echinocandica]|uniref:Expansin-like EG45 domain-containing protein n=1 Tax=Venustampulla echinocandica TaxID=2656787 RepID=A0A370TKV0_9HELO|nr:uncharacterized protein BP5553_06768 [Venustampulla echinocandica]RDL36156.1 hypothetical protein BP5553_06768 [Venustampulla echinocandica]
MHFSSTVAVSALLALADAAVMGKRALSGEATFYGGNVAGGTCSFSTYTLPSNVFGAALSDSNWANSANCGACVSIVDQCPGCGTNHLDLFPEAFSALADPSKGIIDTTWTYVDCPITSPLQLHNKDGVSPYWFSMQVVNANRAVAKLEVSTDGGSTWQSTSRQTYNFFENSSGFGTAAVDVKVTSADGEVVIVKNVPVNSDESVTASSNFAGSSANNDDTSSPVVAAPSAATTAPAASTLTPEPAVLAETPVTTTAASSPATETTPSAEEAVVATPEPIILVEAPATTAVIPSPDTEIAPSVDESVVAPQPTAAPTAAPVKTPCASTVTVVVTVTAGF